MDKVYMVSGGSAIAEVGLLRETKQFYFFNLDYIHVLRGRTYHVPPKVKKNHMAYVIYRNLRDAYAHVLVSAENRRDRITEDLAAAEKNVERLLAEIEQKFPKEVQDAGTDSASDAG